MSLKDHILQSGMNRGAGHSHALPGLSLVGESLKRWRGMSTLDGVPLFCWVATSVAVLLLRSSADAHAVADLVGEGAPLPIDHPIGPQYASSSAPQRLKCHHRSAVSASFAM
jgi:hypothetical protein